MKNFLIALTGLVLLWGLGGCAYPDGYHRGYPAGYYTQSYPYAGYSYSRSYAPPFLAPNYVPYHAYAPDFRPGIHYTRVYYGPAVIYRAPRFYEHHFRYGKTRHRMTHPGHFKGHPGHLPGFHGKKHHDRKIRKIERRGTSRHGFGPTKSVRVEHGVSLEHPVHPREKYTRSPRSGKPGFSAHGEHRATGVKLRDSGHHGNSQPGRHLQSSREHRRPVDDKAGFQAERRSPSSRVEFRGRGKQGHDRVRQERAERRNWRSRIFDRGGGAGFCVGQRC